MVEIVPSILSADFARLGEEIARVESAGISMLHLDVMDGHFVPNLTIGPPLVKCVRKITRLTLDVHLMVTNPAEVAPLFLDAGANQISVHQEACVHLDRTLRLIQERKALAGVVLNPSTPVATLDDILEVADFVLIMSVNPGFGGQTLLPYTLNKVRALVRKRREIGKVLPIEIDGGVHLGNLAEVVEAGVDWVVAGNTVFASEDPASTVKKMQQIAREATAVRA